EGRPDAQLKYELSFWSDLAKWAMLMQERSEEYTVTYDYAAKGLPNFITITLPALKIGFYLSEATLLKIIPSLNTIESDLQVFHAPESEISRIEYDKQEECFIIIGEAKSKLPVSSAENVKTHIPCGSWVFQPEKGFYALDPHPLLSQGKIYDIEGALN